jgi:hypothetical protein
MSKQVELVIKHPAETINAMCPETNIVSADFKRQLAYYRRSCVKTQCLQEEWLSKRTTIHVKKKQVKVELFLKTEP